MCKNLIFLSFLDSQGYDYKVESEVLKVTWDYIILTKERLH